MFISKKSANVLFFIDNSKKAIFFSIYTVQGKK